MFFPTGELYLKFGISTKNEVMHRWVELDLKKSEKKKTVIMKIS